ncbi:hypothetical protein ANN_21153 [Periplaneta americana]|uniref:Uncharacterized protein n=1 Tax=Periplaneta americana TaxID=6978 RepID=A0ABQ8SFR1_PERAM|nr:hypothetical protein ANN_21153 [Periplaneta americana]
MENRYFQFPHVENRTMNSLDGYGPMAGLCEGGNEPPGSLKATSQPVLCSSEASFETGVRLECVRSCVSVRSPEFECTGPQLGDLSSRFSGLSLKSICKSLDNANISVFSPWILHTFTFTISMAIEKNIDFCSRLQLKFEECCFQSVLQYVMYRRLYFDAKKFCGDYRTTMNFV